MVFYVVVEETTLEIAKMSKMSGGNAVINIRTVKMHICVCVYVWVRVCMLVYVYVQAPAF